MASDRSRRRRFLEEWRTDEPDLPAGARVYEFLTAGLLVDGLDLPPCPTGDTNEAWRPWDTALAQTLTSLLPDTTRWYILVMQEGDERSEHRPYRVQATPVADRLQVGSIYGRRWFDDLTLPRRDEVRDWLATFHLVVSQSEVEAAPFSLKGPPERIRDLRVMEVDGDLLATINRSTPDQKETIAMRHLGVVPPNIMASLVSTKPDILPPRAEQ